MTRYFSPIHFPCVDGLMNLTANLSDDLTITPKASVKFMAKGNGFSMTPQILTFDNQFANIKSVKFYPRS